MSSWPAFVPYDVLLNKLRKTRLTAVHANYEVRSWQKYSSEQSFVENYKINLAAYLNWDVEADASQYDNAQTCVKTFYFEVQSAKPATQTQ